MSFNGCTDIIASYEVLPFQTLVSKKRKLDNISPEEENDSHLFLTCSTVDHNIASVTAQSVSALPILKLTATSPATVDNEMFQVDTPLRNVVSQLPLSSSDNSSTFGSFFPWSQLPVEMKRYVLSFLDGKDLCRLSSVSIEWNTYAEDEDLWRSLCIERLGRLEIPLCKSWKWLYRACKEQFKEKRNMKLGRQQSVKGIYEGDWNEDQFNGYGFFTWEDGVKYEGEFKDGKLHGFGKMVWLNQDVFEGHWEDDVKSGFGVFKWKNGDQYVGEYKCNKKNGFGTITWGSHPGEVYKGYWKDDLKEGNGTYSWPNGAEFIGEWSNNKRHGFGKETWITGSVYEGQWFEDEMCGWGKKICVRDNRPDGTYCGEFQNGRANGFGYRVYADGSTYEGCYIDDKRYGFGIYRWTDGCRFEGEWRIGRWEGKFIDLQNRVWEQKWYETEFDKEVRRIGI